MRSIGSGGCFMDLSLRQRLSEVVCSAENFGLTGIRPQVLSDAGNLIVHLIPYPVVARVATLFPGDDASIERHIFERELRVANHLSRCHVPVVLPCSMISPGPHPVGETCMTLWEYAPIPEYPSSLNTHDGLQMVRALTSAMAQFDEPLPPLGAWRHGIEARNVLRTVEVMDERIDWLLTAFDRLTADIQDMALAPAHGDAHEGNLLPIACGWRWVDFEDVSLMPVFWDVASFLAHRALRGERPALEFEQVLEALSREQQITLRRTLEARLISTALTNAGLAWRRQADLPVALSRIDRIRSMLAAWNPL